MPEPAKIDLSLGCALMQIATKSAVRKKVPEYQYECAIRLTMGDGRTEQLARDDEPVLQRGAGAQAAEDRHRRSDVRGGAPLPSPVAGEHRRLYVGEMIRESGRPSPARGTGHDARGRRLDDDQSMAEIVESS